MDWKKDISTYELRKEITQRKILAQIAQHDYVIKAWPIHAWGGVLIIVNFCVSFIGTKLLLDELSSYIRSYVNTYIEPVSLLGIVLPLLFAACVFLVLSAPTFYFIRKERRVYADFVREHPEHAQML